MCDPEGTSDTISRFHNPWLGLVRLMRPKQWIKNGFLLAGPVFAGVLFQTLAPSLQGFLAFCLVSSSVYVINDIADADRDRLHPEKRKRPIPSGAVSPRVALLFAVLLTVVWVPLAAFLSWRFAAVTAIYFFVNLAYSFHLKHVFIVDAMIVAFGFIMRAWAGAVAVNVAISPWLFVCTLLLSLFLAFGKRRTELLTTGSDHRKVLDSYSIELLDQFLSILSGSTITAYSLYTFFATHNYNMMWTIPFVIYGLFRYLYLVHRTDLSGSPEEAILTDRPLLTNLLLWGVAVICLVYA